jgi:hypothetical protein
MNWPAATATGSEAVKAALQLLSVVTVVDPINVFPSPKREPSHSVLEKNSSVKVLSGALLSAPWMVVADPLLTAASRLARTIQAIGQITSLTSPAVESYLSQTGEPCVNPIARVADRYYTTTSLTRGSFQLRRKGGGFLNAEFIKRKNYYPADSS